MNRRSFCHEDFEMLYDDWMIFGNLDIRKTYVAKDIIDKCLTIKYPENKSKEVDESFTFFYNKALAAHQKLSMIMFAEYKYHQVKLEFESTQNMTCPALYGVGKTQILFYLESMMIFARNALDVVAPIYSDILFNKRYDSFNNFSKKVTKSNEALLHELKQYFLSKRDNNISAFSLLCGSEKGRALRDIIIHQTNVQIEYSEYKENSEKERLFLVLKNIGAIELDGFVANFIKEVEDLFRKTTLCCNKYLLN